MTTKTSQVVLMPHFEDTLSLEVLLRRLEPFLNDAQIVIVDDGSVRTKLDEIDWPSSSVSVTILDLKRNVGAQRALAAGLSFICAHYEFDVVVIMDSDGEDAPESIPSLLSYYKAHEDRIDIAVASRLSRQNSLSFRVLYQFYKNLFLMMTGKRMSFGHFSILSSFAANRLINYPELWVHLGSTYFLSRLRIGEFALPRGNRYAGRSKMNLISLLNHGLRSVIALSEIVIPRLLFGGFVSLVGILVVATSALFMSQIFIFLSALFLLLILLLGIVGTTLTMLLLTARIAGGEYGLNNFEDLISEIYSPTAE